EFYQNHNHDIDFVYLPYITINSKQQVDKKQIWEQFKTFIQSSQYYLKILHEIEKFGTIRVLFAKNQILDFSLARIDSGTYTDFRRPDHIEICFDTINHDLLRRDFTINTLAIECQRQANNEIQLSLYKHEYFDAMDDLENKIIKCVGDTTQRIYEDPLRLFRALRFSITKKFKIDQEIIKLIEEDKNILNILIQ